MKEGDHVILYSGKDYIKSIILKKGANIQNKWGTFFHDEIIGNSYGSKVLSKLLDKTRRFGPKTNKVGFTH
jgi:tRNA (adenine57-N1/adenine58-N1)-methyltransferase